MLTLTFLAIIRGKKAPVEVGSNSSEISRLTHFHCTDRKKDLTQRIKGCFQNLICNWNVAVDINFGLVQQDSREPVFRPAPASGASASWSAETSRIMTVKTLGESLHGTSHVSRAREYLQSNYRIQEGSKLGFRKVYIREYEVVPRCNPSVSCGPPLELGWQNSTHRAADSKNMKILAIARDKGEPIHK